MNATSSHRTKPSNDLDPHAIQIQPQDLNALINGLKSREENLIELFDRNLKYKITKSRKELAKLQAAATQYIAAEEERQQLEDRIVNKYLDLQVSEEGQIKLMHKLFKRVSQLASHAKKKLVDLGIFEQTRNTWELAQENERNLRSTLLDIPIDVESVFISIIENSRIRFSHGILALEDVVQSPSFPMQSGRRTTETGLSTTPKPLHDNGNESDNRAGQGQESNRGTKIKRFLTEAEDLTKGYALKSGFKGKNREVGMTGDNKAVPLIMSMQAIRNEVSFSCLFKKDDSTANPRLSIEPPEILNKTPTYKTDYTQKTEPESRTDSRATGTLREKMSASRNLSEGRKTRAKSRSEYIKQDLLPTQPPPSNLPMIRQTARKSIILKKSKSNFEGELEIALKDQTSAQYFLELTRNYDLLKLEQPFNLPSMPKKLEERKVIMERVYNDLIYMNQRIKKTVVQYQLDHLTFFNKKKTQLYTSASQSQKSTPKNQSRDPQFLNLQTPGLHKSNSLTPVGGERPKSTYIKKRIETEPNSADLKMFGRKYSPPKVQNPNPNQNLPQRPLMSRETKTLQITFRPEQEVASIQKISASPPRRNLSPARAAGFGIRTSVTESGQRTKSMKDIKIKMVKTTSLGDSEDLIIDGTQFDKQKPVYMSSTTQADMYKVPREPGGRSMGSSPIGQGNIGNILRPKPGSTQSTASILAKINEEHVLNRDLMNKRYHF